MKINSISSDILLLITIVASFGLVSTIEHDCKILTNFKDDCGNVCGQQNSEVTSSDCGDFDKRGEKIMMIHEGSGGDEGSTEYYNARTYECKNKCPANYQMYKETSFCVKDIDEFESFEKNCQNESSNLWVIILSIVGAIAAAIAAVFAYLKKKHIDASKNKSLEVRASEVGLTKNESV